MDRPSAVGHIEGILRCIQAAAIFNVAFSPDEQ
jgi:hypothetical protein